MHADTMTVLRAAIILFDNHFDIVIIVKGNYGENCDKFSSFPRSYSKVNILFINKEDINPWHPVTD